MSLWRCQHLLLQLHPLVHRLSSGHAAEKEARGEKTGEVACHGGGHYLECPPNPHSLALLVCMS